MKYMVMECHNGYAVVLDENGNFQKVENRQYEVGQTVTDVLPIQAQKRRKPWIYSLIAAAACLVLLFRIALPGEAQPYASVYLKINPEVRMDVDRQDRVLMITGVNPDGADLISDYDFKEKSLELVTEELVDRAVAMGYLQQDGKVTVSLDAPDPTWVEEHSATLSHHLQNHLDQTIPATVQVQGHHSGESQSNHHGHTQSTTTTLPTNTADSHHKNSHENKHGNGHDEK